MSKFLKLLDWIKSNGGEINFDICLDDRNPSNRIIISKSELQSGFTFLKIPKKIVLGGKDINILKTLIKSNNPDDFFFPYREIIPNESEMSEFPFYSMTYKEQLDSVYLCQKFHDSLMELYNRLNIVYWEGELEREVSPHMLKHFLLIIRSRAWSGIGLVPLLDMLNHSFNFNCQVDMISEQEYCLCKTVRPISAGEELTISYCMSSPIEFYTIYGICHPLRLNFLKLTLSADQERLELLQRNGFPETTLVIYLNDSKNDGDREIITKNSKILGFLRISLNGESDPNKVNNLDSERSILLYLRGELLKMRHNNLNTDNEVYRNLITLMKKENEIVDKYLNIVMDYWSSLLSIPPPIVDKC